MSSWIWRGCTVAVGALLLFAGVKLLPQGSESDDRLAGMAAWDQITTWGVGVPLILAGVIVIVSAVVLRRGTSARSTPPTDDGGSGPPPDR